MPIIRNILWVLVAIATGTLAYLYFFDGQFSGEDQQITSEKLGGEFNLLRHDGKPITDGDLTGKPHAIFFGFTNCPEVCPTSLHEMSTWLVELGADADRLNIYFMTVDPQRDTVEILAEYLTSFDNRITGITGEKEIVEKALKSYRVYFKRVELDDGDYSMDHTATIYLLDAKGKFTGSISYGENAKSAIAKLRKLLKS